MQTAQVIGVPDARLGEVGCAYVTLKAGNDPFPKANCSNGAKRDAPTSACRATCSIVDDFESIGMTASGKVQKTKLREHALRELKL